MTWQASLGRIEVQGRRLVIPQCRPHRVENKRSEPKSFDFLAVTPALPPLFERVTAFVPFIHFGLAKPALPARERDWHT